MKSTLLILFSLTVLIESKAQFHYEGPKKDFYALSDMEKAPSLGGNKMGFQLAEKIFKLIDIGLQNPSVSNNHKFQKEQILYFYRTYSPPTHASTNPQYGESNVLKEGDILEDSYIQFTAQLYFDQNQRLILKDSIEIIFHKYKERGTKMLDPLSMVFPVSENLRNQLSLFQLQSKPKLLTNHGGQSRYTTVSFTAPIDFIREKSRYGDPITDATCVVRIKKGIPSLNIKVMSNRIGKTQVESLVKMYLSNHEDLESLDKKKLLIAYEQVFIGIRYHKHYESGPKKYGERVYIHSVREE
ncbi:MAG: hypothetical protein R8G66_10175 [Cytophagales bacterium]|nr:hypothetical protein [Cytophagales bacterium]